MNLERWLAGPKLEASVAGRIRKEQLGAILHLTPLMMLANLVNGAILIHAFWPSGPKSFLLIWYAALGMTAWLGLKAWSRSRLRPAPHTVSPRGVRRAAWHGFTLGAVWASLPLTLFPIADGPQQLLLAALMTGMIAGGGFALSTVPCAAFAYASPMIAASLAALILIGEPIYLMVAVLLLTYSLIVARSILWHADLFVERLQNQFELGYERELIGILLRDFEESASDWLWETDAEGRLHHVSHRLADVLGKGEDELQGCAFVDLLTRHERRSQDDDDMLRRLLESFRQRSPFRDQVVDVTVDGDKRFWSLTAKPVYDVQGLFQGYRGVGTDVTDKIRAERRLAYLAHVDPLTDLANRSRLEGRLGEGFDGLERWGEGFALICLDLDGFKAVNDNHGHAAGDRLLDLVAKRLKRCAREGDTVARIGGDEFAVLQKAADQPPASLVLADRIVRTLAAPFDLDGQRVSLGASAGIAIAGRDGKEPVSLMRNADVALYRAKNEGRGRFVRYEPGMTTNAQAPKALAGDLAAALARGEMTMQFQPVVRADSGEVVAVEALLVWQHREQGVIAPSRFLSIAEDTGLIAELGAFAIDRTLEAAARWPAHLRLSLPLAAGWLASPDFDDVVRRALAGHELAPARLEFVVSTAVLDHAGASPIDALQALRDREIKIALDGFAPDSSPLDALCRFPFDRVKLAPSQHHDRDIGRDRVAVLRAIIDLVHTLGMTTTAAGVDAEHQLWRLRRERCAEVQGSLVCRPAPAMEISTFLDGWSGWPRPTVPAIAASRPESVTA